jgi:hypothetical protein
MLTRGVELGTQGAPINQATPYSTHLPPPPPTLHKSLQRKLCLLVTPPSKRLPDCGNWVAYQGCQFFRVVEELKNLVSMTTVISSVQRVVLLWPASTNCHDNRPIYRSSLTVTFFLSGNPGNVVEFLQTGNILEGSDAGSHFFNTAMSLLHLFPRDLVLQ